MIRLSSIFDIIKPEGNSTQQRLRWFATIFIILFGTCYMPVEGRIGFGIIKLSLMIIAVFVLLGWTFKTSKALFIGVLYATFQYLSASFYPESFRWSTLLFSFGFVVTYICMYNLIYIERVFSIRHFIRLMKWMMMAYFVVCIIQQVFLLIGISYFPAINLVQVLDRGIGCNSLSMEPSTFARTMLVCYYAYVKCNEYLRGEGPFSLRELFSGEHKWVTIRFLWMMTTMGSGTAYVCLILFALYFVREYNWYYVIPFLVLSYWGLQQLEVEGATRAVGAISATATMDGETVRQTDGSAASRIAPLLNSLEVDLTKVETWFGYGIDYSRGSIYDATLFDSYGLVFYIISLILNFACAYKFLSLGTIFMFAGVGGGAGTNIHYVWFLMIIMTAVRYFYDNRYKFDLDEKNAADIV